MFRLRIFPALLMATSLSGLAQTPADEPPVRKSIAGICYSPGAIYYEKIRNFTPYRTLADCLQSGGRLPDKRHSRLGA